MKTEDFVALTPEQEKEQRVRSLIDERWFTPSTVFVDDPPMLRIGKTKALSLGSFSTTTGQQKAGKGWNLALVVDGFLNGGHLSAAITERKRVVIIDTEQSGTHAQRLMKAVGRMGGNEDKISGVRLRGTVPDDIAAAVEIIIQDHHETTALFILDGVADAVNNGVNDETEGKAFVVKLMELTEKYKVHIIGVLHQNKKDTNATGFFGGYMVKKGELTFAVKKDETIDGWIHTVDYLDTRDMPIQSISFKVEGGEEPYPVIVDVPKAAGQFDPKRCEPQTHQMRLDAIFDGTEPFNSGEIVEKLRFQYSVGGNKAKDLKQYMLEKQWVVDVGSGSKRQYKRGSETPIQNSSNELFR